MYLAIGTPHPLRYFVFLWFGSYLLLLHFVSPLLHYRLRFITSILFYIRVHRLIKFYIYISVYIRYFVFAFFFRSKIMFCSQDPEYKVFKIHSNMDFWFVLSKCDKFSLFLICTTMLFLTLINPVNHKSYHIHMTNKMSFYEMSVPVVVLDTKYKTANIVLC